MGWPAPNDYDEAAENLRYSMSDDELRAGQAALDDQQLPMVWAGSFASVYRIDCPATGKSWALKCFTREVSARQGRYRHIAEHLQAARLPFTVPFVYLERGIQVHGQWFPAVKMEWVEGQTLNRFVEESLEKPRMLRQLLDLWPKLAARLREARIAHADLQHGNVLLVPAAHGKLALKLIDYDGMYVPALAGTPSGELGHSNYQHPDRLRRRAYNADVDRFSHLVIYSAVHCLLVGRRDLWRRFNNDENLLFREEDFRRPAESELFWAVCDMGDATSRALAGRLLLACGQPLEASPWLDQIVRRERAVPLTRSEQQAVASLLVARSAVPAAAGVSPPTPAVPAGPAGTARVALAGTTPAAEAGTVPLGARVAAAGKSLSRGFATAARPVDGLLRRLVGDENELLRYFLWAVFPLLLFAAVWLAASVGLRTSSSPEIAEKPPAESAAKLKLRPVAPQAIEAGKPLTVTVTPENADAWKGKVRYSFAGKALAGATIGPETGVFNWTPPLAEPAGQQEISVSATGREDQTTRTRFIITVTRPIPAPATLPGKEIAVDLGGGVKLELLLIPAGEFLMGSPDSDKDAGSDERPQHRVRITKPFYLGKYLVTQEQWGAVMGNNPSHLNGPKNPVEHVSWDDCQTFLDKLNERFGVQAGGFQLPTEVQWEYACRSGSTTRYCFGDDERQLGEYAWYEANSGGKTHPVGGKRPNAWGLFDMHGNVWEWCADWYDERYYAGSLTDDPTGPATGLAGRLLRGGGWRDPAGFCRSAYRTYFGPAYRGNGRGLRVSRVAGEAVAGTRLPESTAPLKIQPIPPQTVEAGKPLSIAVAVEDAQQWGGKLRYSLDPNAPHGAKIAPETGAFTWTPAEDPGPGKYDVTVSAQGPDGQTAQTMFTVTVTKAAPGPEPTAAETKWISAARQAAAERKGVLVQHLPVTGGAARVPPESLGDLASQKLYLGVGKLDGDAGQCWDFGQGFENMPPGSTREVPSLATTTGHGRVDVSLETRPDGLYLVLRGISQSGAAADSGFTRTEEALSKAMATIRGWYTAEPGPERKEVARTLFQDDVNLRVPTFEPLPAPPRTPSTMSRTPALLSRQVATTQAYELAKARRKSQVDSLLNKIQNKLEVLKKRAKAVHGKSDTRREAADQALETACKSITAVVYPTVVEIEGNHLYQLGDWRLYWSSDRKFIHVWCREGSLAVEIIGDGGGWWRWRDGDQEYVVWSAGNTSRQRFSKRPWEQPGPAPARGDHGPRRPTLGGANQEPPGSTSATVIRNFPEFSAGRTRLWCDGGQISVVLDDGGTLSVSLTSPEVLFKTATKGRSLKFSSGSLAVPGGAQ